MNNNSKIGRTHTYKIELHITTSECNELVELLNRIGEERISKYEAMQYVNCSKATFDRLVLSGKIPQGRKQAGFKEKFWYKSEILQCNFAGDKIILSFYFSGGGIFYRPFFYLLK